MPDNSSPQKSALVLAPHPDDESLGCGGTVRLLTQAGTPVDVLFLTRGENGMQVPDTEHESLHAALAVTREAEARAACQVLGVRDVEFLDGNDGQLLQQPHLVQPLAARLAERRYPRVFCPWYGDAHIDHLATFLLLQRALRETGLTPMIWLYEIWTPLVPTDYVPIGPTLAAKRQAIEQHQSQLVCLDYLSGFVGLASYRALTCPPARYAEAFLVMDTPALLAISAAHVPRG